jgi:hypothetical protein
MPTSQASQDSTLPTPVKVIFSYSHKDESFLNELHTHLSPLKRQGLISTWHDREITAGSEFDHEIAARFNEANVILLLITADFINSDYCHDIEMKRALERHEAGEAIVIPIFLRPCDWKGEPFGKLLALPTDGKPVNSAHWHSRDEAYAVIAKEIRKVISDWQTRKSQATQGNHPSGAPTAPPLAITSLGSQPPTYSTPKPRNASFNAYQAGRDVLAFLEQELSARIGLFEQAGYIVDCHQREGRVCLRIEADGRTVYFLDMWQGGMLSNDKGLAFYHGWGNPTGNAMTATATLVPDERTGEAQLDVLNFSLLKDVGTQRSYSKEEFLNELWEEIVSTVNQLGKR